MTLRQRKVWRLRYRFGWKMKRIGMYMRMSENAVSKMLARAYVKTGMPRARISVMRTKPRSIRMIQLSQVVEEY